MVYICELSEANLSKDLGAGSGVRGKFGPSHLSSQPGKVEHSDLGRCDFSADANFPSRGLSPSQRGVRKPALYLRVSYIPCPAFSEIRMVFTHMDGNLILYLPTTLSYFSVDSESGQRGYVFLTGLPQHLNTPEQEWLEEKGLP